MNSREGHPERESRDEAIETRRFDKLLRRMDHAWVFRTGGALIGVLLFVASAACIAFTLGRIPIWLLTIGFLGLFVAGPVGEAFGRAIEQRGASEFEVTLSHAILWHLDGGSQSLQYYLNSSPDQTKLWLQRLAVGSRDDRIRSLAKEVLGNC